jgi:two-component system response regulator GlrR
LRVIQEREFSKVGDTKTLKTNIRILTATNKDLKAEVNQGRFREDLFYRVNSITIKVPPLRERAEDIPLIALHYVKKIAVVNNKEVKRISHDAMETIVNYRWPGNVRELENTIEYAVVMTQGDAITEDLILQTKGMIYQEPLKPLKEAKVAYERSYLIHLLEICDGNVSRASKLAGKYRSDFYDLLRKHGLKNEDFKKPA